MEPPIPEIASARQVQATAEARQQILRASSLDGTR